ncbi:MAG: YdbH domain-containing protein [Phycisphaerae bacterium]|nr:YdbH domain-containing protein [Phycisphaerae bacterium]
MSEEVKVQKKGSPRKVLKVIKWCLVVLAGVVLLIFFGVPLYLSSSGGTNLLLGKINQSVDGQVQMDDFSIGWFKGIKLTKLSYADSSGNTFVTIDSVETQPRYMSLLGGKVKLGKTVIDRPQVYLKVSHGKKQPAAADGSKAQTKQSAASAAVFPVNQMNLELIDGSATIELIGNGSQKVRFTNIASNVQIADAGKPSALDISMDVNDASKISAKGTATPAKKGWMLEGGDFNVQISKLQLASLKPLFALAGQPMDMAGELNADATIQINQNQVQQLKADAVISHFAQGSGDRRMVFEKPITISAKAGQDGKIVKIDQFKVESEFCNAVCAGTLEAMTYNIDADLAQTQRLVGQFTDMGGLSMQGNLAASGNVSMTDEAVKAAGKGTVTKLVIKKEEVSTPATDAQMDFDCTVDQVKKQLRLASANMAAAPGTVKIANMVLPMGDQSDKTISLDAQITLDLAKTWAFAGVFAELPEGLQVAGMLDSAVNVSTQAGTTQILTDKTQISQLKITQPDSAPFVQEKVSLNADILLDTDAQTIDVRKLDMEAADGQSLIKITKGKVEKKISNNTTKMSGGFEAQYDLKTVTAFASAYLPQGLVLEGRRSDFLHFESQYPTDKPDLMMANLNAGGAVGFDKASYQGLNFGPTEVKLNVRQGQAAIDIPDADVNGGKVRFAGDINLAEKPMLLRLRKPAQAETVNVIENVRIDDVISATLLQYLNPVFANGTGVTGTANLSCSTLAIPLGGGTPKDINLAGSVGLTDVHLNSPLLGLFEATLKDEGLDLFSIPPSPFTVKNGRVEYADMPMMFGSDFTLHFSGKIGLEDQSLAMNVGIPVNDRNIPVPLGGTLTKPKLDMGKLIESQGRQIIEQEIQRGLEKIFK